MHPQPRLLNRFPDGPDGPEGDGGDGAVRVRVLLPVESTAVAVGDLLRLGTEAEVLGPAGLRAAVAREVEALADRYGRGTGESA